MFEFKIGDIVEYPNNSSTVLPGKELEVVAMMNQEGIYYILVYGMSNGHDGRGYTLRDEKGNLIEIDRTIYDNPRAFYWIDQEKILLIDPKGIKISSNRVKHIIQEK